LGLYYFWIALSRIWYYQYVIKYFFSEKIYVTSTEREKSCFIIRLRFLSPINRDWPWITWRSL